MANLIKLVQSGFKNTLQNLGLKKAENNLSKDAQFLAKIDEVLMPLVLRQKFLYRVDISHWRQGQEEALDIYRPRRIVMQEVYFDALQDAHLQAVLQSRTLNALNIPFKISDDKTGEIDDSLTRFFKKKWFFKFLRFAMEAKYHDYSVIGLNINRGLIDNVHLLPRENIIPDTKEVLLDVNSEQTISLEASPYNNLYIFVGGKDFGLLNECAPHTIFKKRTLQFWSQFQEMFGVPFRFATYTGNNKQVIDRIEQTLQEMGSAAYGLFPHGTTIDFKEVNRTDVSNVFNVGIDRANSEISKRVLGQTMTTDGGQSYAQASVHADKESDITKADLRELEFEVNDNLSPILMRWGVPLQGKRFEFDLSKRLPLAQYQLSIDQWLSQSFDIDQNYIEKTYGTPVKPKALPEPNPKEPNPNPEPEEGEGAEEEEGEEVKPQPKKTKGHTHFKPLAHFYAADNTLLAIFLRLAEKVFKGTLKEVLDTDLFTYYKNQYQNGISDGFETSIDKLPKNSPEAKLFANLLTDAEKFAAYKTFQVIKELKILAGKYTQEGADEYTAAAQKIHNNHNVSYLETEANTYLAATQNARNWLQYEKDKDIFPYLKWQTAGDERVRKSHDKLDGITLPVDDDFWDTHQPPLDHNCRCELIQVTKIAKPTDKEKLKDLPTYAPELATNPAKTGKVYTTQHPYYKDVAEADTKKIEKFIKNA
jgi:SPP1 gp7 family putative phage head morphogenesis protein